VVLIFKNTTKTELLVGTSWIPGVHPADGLVLACEEHLTPVPVPAAGQHQLCNQSIAISQQRSYRLINQATEINSAPSYAICHLKLCSSILYRLYKKMCSSSHSALKYVNYRLSNHSSTVPAMHSINFFFSSCQLRNPLPVPGTYLTISSAVSQSKQWKRSVTSYTSAAI